MRWYLRRRIQLLWLQYTPLVETQAAAKMQATMDAKLPAAAETPPKEHVIQKGETLSGIASENGTTVEKIIALNNKNNINIKNPDKINAGQRILVPDPLPELDFKTNEWVGGYNNPTNGDVTRILTDAKVVNLQAEFIMNSAATDPSTVNTVVAGGDLNNEVKNLPSVNNIITKGLISMLKDNKLSPGEFYMEDYDLGSLTGPNGRRIMWNSVKDLFSDKSWEQNSFNSAENFLGGYRFTMRITDDGKHMIMCVYDSKTIKSASDHRKSVEKVLPNLEATYQRYIWSYEVNDIKAILNKYFSFKL